MEANYEICVRGRMGPELKHALADLRPREQGQLTRLSAEGLDQAALLGVLGRLRDLALEIDSVLRTAPDSGRPRAG